MNKLVWLKTLTLLVGAVLLPDAALAQQVYLSLGSTNIITTNNTEVLITDIGEDIPGGLPYLTCHTDLTACCRNIDNNKMGSLGGEWRYPDGRMVQINANSMAAGEGFYRVRNAPQVVRLARRDNFLPPVLTPTGSFCCVIPTTGEEMTFCANIVMCLSLPLLTNGMISYSDSTLGVGSVATHSCDTGYTLNGGSITRTCQSDGTWSGSVPTCGVVDCGGLSPPTNGMVSLTGTTIESTATYSCDTGYTLNGGSTTRTCQSDRTWSGAVPTCKVTDCGQPTVLNGHVQLYTGGTIFNSVVMYSCDSCFTRRGVTTSVCFSNGEWTPPPPTCQIITCNPPPTINNGIIQLASSRIDCNSSAIYSCDRGYQLQGDSTLTCQPNRKWSDEAPVCRSIDCGTLSDPTNGQVSTPFGTTFMRVASYSCDDGYTLVGSMTRTCEDNGQWMPAAEPYCEAVDCGTLSAPGNGRVDTSSGTTFMSMAIYSCNTGYYLRGRNKRTCTAGGVWSPPPPSCPIVSCGTLSHPRNGQVSTENGVTYGSVATYSCDMGYMLDGPEQRTCLASGQWSQSPPSCPPVACEQLEPPQNGRVDTSQGYHFMNTATYSCDADYNLTGCNSSECLSSGSWSCDPPFCADNAMIQLKFGPTSHCVVWSDWMVQILYGKMQSSILEAVQRAGYVIPEENIQRGYFSCYRSTTETTYRTTITGTEGVTAVDYARLIQEWVESGVTTRVQWYVIKIDKNCPVSIMSMDDDECV